MLNKEETEKKRKGKTIRELLYTENGWCAKSLFMAMNYKFSLNKRKQFAFSFIR